MKNTQQDLNQDIEFSIINPHKQKKNSLDFSLQSLLSNDQFKQSSVSQFHKNQNQPIIDGSFMKGLQKMEKQISYESIPFNIYQNSQYPVQFTGTMQAKHQSTCARTLNNMTKVGSRLQQKKSEPDVKYLILDFKQEHQKNQHQKQKVNDYFAPNKCWRCYKSQINHSPGLDRNSYKINKNSLAKTTKFKSSIIQREKSANSFALSHDPNFTKKYSVKSKKNQKMKKKKKVLLSKSKSKSSIKFNTKSNTKQNLNQRNFFKSKSGIKKFKAQKDNMKEDVISEYYGYQGFRSPKIQNGLTKEFKKSKQQKQCKYSKESKYSKGSKDQKQSKSRKKGKNRRTIYSNKNLHKY